MVQILSWLCADNDMPFFFTEKIVLLCFLIGYITKTSYRLFLLEGFQCIVKLSWHFLYIYGTRKQRYEINYCG